MKKLLVILILSTTLFAACSDDDEGTPAPPEVNIDEIVEGILDTLPNLTGNFETYVLNSVANPDINGKAIFAERTDNYSYVIISLDGTPSGGSHPAHIHNGMAPGPGDIAISLENVDGNTGISMTEVISDDAGANISYGALTSFDGYINVHLSDTELETLVAQGDIGANAGIIPFKVTIENVSRAFDFFQSGVFNTPVGALSPGPVLPGSGDTYQFSFYAGPSVLPNTRTRLSFLTMLVASNDLFLAPLGTGIDLYDENGNPINGDITDQVFLWDAGTEVNRAPGSSDQPGPGNMPPGSGTPETANIQLLEEVGGVIPVNITNDTDMQETIDYPAVNELVKVSIDNDGVFFTVTIENLSAGTIVETPLSPGGYLVHTADNPIFTNSEPERGNGIEQIAEDGDASVFGDFLVANTGLTVPLSPGVWALHEDGVNALFDSGSPDRGEGLVAIAEDGDPGALGAALAANANIISSDVIDTPDGADTPGPIGPGGSYSFTVFAQPGYNLAFSIMFVQSNDWIYTFSQGGMPLFKNGSPVNGDVTNAILLYDVGSEVDQFPGAGLDQVIRQSGPDTGANDENNVLRRLNFDDTDPFEIPPTNQVVKVTVTPIN